MSGWWAGGGGQGGLGGWRVLPAGGIRASQGTFSSYLNISMYKLNEYSDNTVCQIF